MPAFNPSASAHYGGYPDYQSRYPQRPSAYEAYRSGYNSFASNSVHDLNAVLPDPYQYKSAASDASLKVPQGRYGSSAHGLSAGYPLMPLPNPWASSGYSAMGCGRRRMDGYYQEQRPQPKEEKPVGGVSATLDYDMEQMTTFVAQSAESIVRPGASPSSDFRKWVLQVLNATRLPSATILLSLSYMSMRVHHLSAAGLFRVNNRTVYSTLTVALILGSKFLDDNTFQNKSWAEVSNIPTDELNRTERDWLIDFGHRLHYNVDCHDGFAGWEKQWKDFGASAAQLAPVAATAALKLNTDVRFAPYDAHANGSSPYPDDYARSATGGYSPGEAYSDAYPTPYTPYDPWYGNGRSVMDRSPTSAPHSGPHTPEYYGGQHLWGPVDTYGRREPYYASNYGYNTTSSARHFGNTGYGAPAAAATGHSYWNCHGAACQCTNCRSTSMASRHGPVVCG